MIPGQTVRLRRADPKDAHHFARWTNDPTLRATVYRHLPTTTALQEQAIAQLTASDAHLLTIIEAPDDGMNFLPVGACGLHDIHPITGTAVLGIMIEASRHGRGYGTDAVRTLCAFGFCELNLHKVELTVLADNAPAIRVYEKVGFRREALKRRSLYKRGAYRDELLMGLLREELHPPAPQSGEPRPIGAS